jgi:hypothetical protein
LPTRLNQPTGQAKAKPSRQPTWPARPNPSHPPATLGHFAFHLPAVGSLFSPLNFCFSRSGPPNSHLSAPTRNEALAPLLVSSPSPTLPPPSSRHPRAADAVPASPLELRPPPRSPAAARRRSPPLLSRAWSPRLARRPCLVPVASFLRRLPSLPRPSRRLSRLGPLRHRPPRPCL